MFHLHMATTRPSPKILSPTASVETMLGVSISRHTKWFSLVAHSIKNLPAIKDESEVTQSCLTLCEPMGCSLPGSSVHGIFQARVLEWVAISFSKGIFLTWRSNSDLLHCRQTLYHLSHQGSICYDIDVIYELWRWACRL